MTTAEVAIEDRRQQRGWLQTPRLFVVLYAVAFVVQEAIGATFGIVAQMGVLAVLILVAVNHALFGYRNARTAAVVMTALFVTRIIIVSLPVSGVSLSTRAGLIAVISIVIARLTLWVLAHDVSETRAVEGFALRRPVISRDFTTFVVAFSGIPIGVAAYALLDTTSMTVSPIFDSLGGAWTLVVALLALAAMADEMLYRQLVAAMVQHTGNSQTPIVSGVLYGAIFIATLNPLLVLLAGLTGAWFAWSCERTGSLQGPVMAHILINILVFVVMPSSGLAF